MAVPTKPAAWDSASARRLVRATTSPIWSGSVGTTAMIVLRVVGCVTVIVNFWELVVICCSSPFKRCIKLREKDVTQTLSGGQCAPHTIPRIASASCHCAHRIMLCSLGVVTVFSLLEKSVVHLPLLKRCFERSLLKAFERGAFPYPQAAAKA